MNDDYRNDLSQTLEFLRHQLSRAIVDVRHELHQVYLVTIGTAYPEVRTVILRSVDWEANSIAFHTDSRSKKFVELSQNVKTSFLGYSHKKKYQIRFRGRTILNYNNEVAKESWQRLSVASRRCYLVSSPGSSLEEAGSGLNQETSSADLQLQSTEIGFNHFAVVTFVIEEIEWLLLARDGHRRALYKFGEGQKKPIDQTWLCP